MERRRRPLAVLVLDQSCPELTLQTGGGRGGSGAPLLGRQRRGPAHGALGTGGGGARPEQTLDGARERPQQLPTAAHHGLGELGRLLALVLGTAVCGQRTARAEVRVDVTALPLNVCYRILI